MWISVAVGVGLLWPGVGFRLGSDHISNSSLAPGPVSEPEPAQLLMETNKSKLGAYTAQPSGQIRSIGLRTFLQKHFENLIFPVCVTMIGGTYQLLTISLTVTAVAKA